MLLDGIQAYTDLADRIQAYTIRDETGSRVPSVLAPSMVLATKKRGAVSVASRKLTRSSFSARSLADEKERDRSVAIYICAIYIHLTAAGKSFTVRARGRTGHGPKTAICQVHRSAHICAGWGRICQPWIFAKWFCQLVGGAFLWFCQKSQFAKCICQTVGVALRDWIMFDK